MKYIRAPRVSPFLDRVCDHARAEVARGWLSSRSEGGKASWRPIQPSFLLRSSLMSVWRYDQARSGVTVDGNKDMFVFLQLQAHQIRSREPNAQLATPPVQVVVHS